MILLGIKPSIFLDFQMSKNQAVKAAQSRRFEEAEKLEAFKDDPLNEAC